MLPTMLFFRNLEPVHPAGIALGLFDCRKQNAAKKPPKGSGVGKQYALMQGIPVFYPLATQIKTPEATSFSAPVIFVIQILFAIFSVLDVCTLI